ncbi:hypothetical protein FA13DRAFT_142525 [Coprinellus micaceus]|uniref:Uncharacterized protein n=1 Tax=Coprinellus micaceus TaxID=71717 RepID=A0A4Y7SH83_COPMI|nr:hypothetical protein FA13DRAFT_142525 [Coprinellus micaceus]
MPLSSSPLVWLRGFRCPYKQLAASVSFLQIAPFLPSLVAIHYHCHILSGHLQGPHKRDTTNLWFSSMPILRQQPTVVIHEDQVVKLRFASRNHSMGSREPAVYIAGTSRGICINSTEPLSHTNSIAFNFKGDVGPVPRAGHLRLHSEDREELVDQSSNRGGCDLAPTSPPRIDPRTNPRGAGQWSGDPHSRGGCPHGDDL